MSKPPEGSGGRFLRLAGLSARLGGEMAREQLSKLWRDGPPDPEHEAARYTRIGADIARTLGGMKGAVMKVGQIVSQYRDLLPPELVQALTTLQKDAPPHPWEDIERRLRENYRQPLDALFSDIDPVPLAAASLAQVHRARRLDGREVVLKVQYPGVDAAVASDLRQLKVALKLARVLPVSGELLDAVFAEIRRSLEDELDYRLEAQAVTAFRDFHRDDPLVVIPSVHEDLSSRHVLVLSHEPGDPLGALPGHYDQDLRNALGLRLFRTLGRQLYIQRWLHCDPHPGNFAARSDGSLVIYDFGCLKRLPEPLVGHYRELSRAMLDGSASLVESALIRMGGRNTHHQAILGSDFYQPWLALGQQVFSAQPVDFGRRRLAERALALSREALPQWRAFQPVPDAVMLNRALGGHYWNLRQLGAQLALRPLLEELLDASGR